MSKIRLVGVNLPIAYELEQGFNTIGRNPTNDLRIRDATVSSFHCEVVLQQDSVLIRDLGSSNGTFVEDQLVEEKVVAPGTTLRIGNVELRLEIGTEVEPVRISVPKLTPDAVPTAAVLPDGYPACLEHPQAHATFGCKSCGKTYCPDCVRVLGLKQGETRVFCPACSGLCDPLPVPPGVSTTPSKGPQSILGRLSQTIRIRSK